MENIGTYLESIVNWITISSLVASGVSIALGVLAIFLAIYFFQSTKMFETEIKLTTNKIETTSLLLSQITDRHFDRLSNIISQQHVNQQSFASEAISLLKMPSTKLLDRDQFQEISKNKESSSDQKEQDTDRDSFISGHGIPSFNDPYTREQLQKDAATFFLLVYYYSTHANFIAQMVLPSANEYDPENAAHKVIKNMLDMSFHDFSVSADRLERFAKENPSLLVGHQLFHLGEEGKKVREIVKDSAARFSELAKHS